MTDGSLWQLTLWQLSFVPCACSESLACLARPIEHTGVALSSFPNEELVSCLKSLSTLESMAGECVSERVFVCAYVRVYVCTCVRE